MVLWDPFAFLLTVLFLFLFPDSLDATKASKLVSAKLDPCRLPSHPRHSARSLRSQGGTCPSPDILFTSVTSSSSVCQPCRKSTWRHTRNIEGFSSLSPSWPFSALSHKNAGSKAQFSWSP